MRIGRETIDSDHKRVIFSIGDISYGNLESKIRSGEIGQGRIYELRYDLFQKRSGESLLRMLDLLNRGEISYVFKYMGNDSDALSYTSLAARNGAPCIDVDFSMMDDIDPEGATVISSIHLWETRPDEQMILDMTSSDAQMVKVAVKYDSYDTFFQDLLLVFSVSEKSEKSISFVPMGDQTKMMRIISLLTVSDMTYAGFDGETAPGQPTFNEIRSIMDIAGVAIS